jgi:hypothetical protein
MIVGKVSSLPLIGAPERCFTRVGYGLIRKLYTMLEKLARYKRSSLLQKSFMNLATGVNLKLFSFVNGGGIK